MNFDIPRAASKVLAATDTARVDETLLSLADALEKRADELLAANAADCAPTRDTTAFSSPADV